MTRDRRPVGAAVDLGSNSVHLLVAAIDGHRLEPLVDESVFLGLGDALHDGGLLGRERRAALVALLERYADTARRLGAGPIAFIGTEPLRRAADASRIVHEVEWGTGVPLHVVSHEEEALLNLVGVLEGRAVEADTLVVDIGGGSSEFAVVGPDRPASAVGLLLGSARLRAIVAAGDPPTLGDIEAMRLAARRLALGAPPVAPREIVGVGGTASNLLKVVPEALVDRVLTRQRLARILAILAAEPADVVMERYRVKPVRARLLPAGAIIVETILRCYGVDAMRVSNASLREGAVLAMHRAGPAWRDRLADLARGWRD